jgi:(S)-ureidoglycine aminohydrolase
MRTGSEGGTTAQAGAVGQGQGVYLPACDWHEVEPTDFIWMAPFCPRDFFCTGWGEAAYRLYKDVNRNVRFS